MLGFCPGVMHTVELHAMQARNMPQGKLQEQLLTALKAGDQVAIKKAVAAGADVNARYIATDIYKRETSILNNIIGIYGNLSVLKNLLHYFPNVNINNSFDLPAIINTLDNAFQYGNSSPGGLTLDRENKRDFDILKLLLSKGLLVNARYTEDQGDLQGYTHLHRIVSLLKWQDLGPHQKATLNLLMEYGADPEIKNIQGKTAWDLIPTKYNAEVTKIIQNGRAAYLKKRDLLLQEHKAAAASAGEHGLPGGIASFIAEYAVGDEDVAAELQAEAQESKSQGEQKAECKKS